MNQTLTSTPLRDAIYAMALAKPHMALRLGSGSWLRPSKFASGASYVAPVLLRRKSMSRRAGRSANRARTGGVNPSF